MKKLVGYFHTKELKNIGFTDRKILSLQKEGKLLKIRKGLYRNADLFLQDQSFLDVCYAVPYAIITGFSALSYYGLTTHIPQQISIAIPKEKQAPQAKTGTADTRLQAPFRAAARCRACAV